MPTYESQISLILRWTHQGEQLTIRDQILLERVANGQASDEQFRELERLYQYVDQHQSAPRDWLFGLSGLEITPDGLVLFEGTVVQVYHQDGNELPPALEMFTRDILYPACMLAREYGYRHLSPHRISFFVNELFGTFPLRAISQRTYLLKESMTAPAATSELGFLNGHAVCHRRGESLFQPFLRLDSGFFYCERFLTVSEFESVEPGTWRIYLPEEKKDAAIDLPRLG